MKMKRKWTLFYLATITSVLVASHIGSSAVTVISENTPVQRSSCIVIDAGHGGIDGGAVSCSGFAESKYNLEIALRLNDLLNLLGHKTRMTRSTDISIYSEGETIAQKKRSDLIQRVQIVNEIENAYLLSIHQNHFPDSQYRGAQVFFSSSIESENLANSLQKALVSTINQHSNRQAKKCSGIYLMDHIHCPGVLIECGFLSNPEEEALLRNPIYQKKLCCVISCAVNLHLSNT